MNKRLLVIGWLLLTACQSSPEMTATDTVPTPKQSTMRLLQPEVKPDEEPPEEAAPNEWPNALAQPARRQIIRNAQLRFRVSDFMAAGRAIGQIVRQVNGQITYANETRTGNTIENALVVRVPANQLDSFVTASLSQSIFTDTKTITSEDVTRRYVDIDARIRSKRATEETYLRLLKQARGVEDVLKVEEQLGHIREEREVQEAELRQLENEVALSTVNLTYYQETDVTLRPEEPAYTLIARNLTAGIQLLGSTLVGLFYFLPLGLAIALIIWLVIRWRRRRNAL